MSSSGSSNVESDGVDSNHSGRSSGRKRILIGISALVLVAIAGVLVTGYFRTLSAQEQQIQLWPTGTAQDIENLAAREDINVLFILVDTLRADRMSAYGYERATTPILQNLSRAGIRFDRHLAQSSWTKASMASLWTSFYPTRTGVVAYDDIVPDEAVMPAEVFAEEGFRTIGLYRNGWVAPVFGFDQGFEIYKKPIMTRASRPDQATNPTAIHRGNDEEIIKTAMEFLRVEGDAEKPWFLYLHLMDVHEYTYDEASAIFGSSYSDNYDSSVLWTDTTIDIFLGNLVDWGLLRNTIVVIASDHGEAFRERGHEGHARFVYRETIETPFIILLPFRLDNGGIIVSSRSRNVDIFPTLYDLLGIEPPVELAEADGVSLLPDILAAAEGRISAEAFGRDGFSHLRQGWGQRKRKVERSTFSLSSGYLRYVHQQTGSESSEELFDAESDPLELEDLSAERPEELASMRSRARQLAEFDPVWGTPKTREINELELNQLRALGYEIE
jgi:arylsulfatase A-like enzyme